MDIESDSDGGSLVMVKIGSITHSFDYGTMCFQKDIENQYNFMQGGWANQNNFVAVNVGLDTIIGQPAGAKVNQKWPQT